jgi:putative ABC transport system permease protein
LPGPKYAEDAKRIAFQNETLKKIRALPGVTSAGTVTFLPLSGWEGLRSVARAGRAIPEDQRLKVLWSSATPGYFESMGIPLIAGRFFEDADRQGRSGVTIVSKSLAQQLGATDGELLGKQIEVEGVKEPVEVVGVEMYDIPERRERRRRKCTCRLRNCPVDCCALRFIAHARTLD